MMILTIAVIIFSCFSVSSGQFLNCDWVQSLDCTTYGDNKDCGSDGITYDNRCYFARAQCLNKDLKILHVGACAPNEVSTTPAPAGSGTSGEVAILDFFCVHLSHKDCPLETNLVCGTDNREYLNYCEYDKHRCTHRDLHVQVFGPCPNSPNTSTEPTTTTSATATPTA